MAPHRDNIDSREIEHFERHAAEWWDVKGPLKALHDINPLRCAYIAKRCAIQGKSLLDVGCGGGILSEALAKAGARVTGIDVAPTGIGTARRHMKLSAVDIDYRLTTVEALARRGGERFDIITCMELLEHVPQPQSIIDACAALLNVNGDIFLATVNRSWTAYVFVLLVAERLLKIVRKGTHSYRNLVKPEALATWAVDAGLEVKDVSGFLYVPFAGQAVLWPCRKMNYLMHLHKPAKQNRPPLKDPRRCD